MKGTDNYRKCMRNRPHLTPQGGQVLSGTDSDMAYSYTPSRIELAKRRTTFPQADRDWRELPCRVGEVRRPEPAAGFLAVVPDSLASQGE